MDWRRWAYESLQEEFAGEAVAASIFGSGSVTEVPEAKPFIVLTFGDTVPQVANANFRQMQVWVHDRPGDYGQIDEMLIRSRTRLVGPVNESTAIACNWQGDSTDLADDFYKTIVKNSSFRLVGRDNNVRQV